MAQVINRFHLSLVICLILWTFFWTMMSVWGIAWGAYNIANYSQLNTWFEATCTVMNDSERTKYDAIVHVSDKQLQCYELFDVPSYTVNHQMQCLTDAHDKCTIFISSLHSSYFLYICSIIVLCLSISACTGCFCRMCAVTQVPTDFCYDEVDEDRNNALNV